MLAVSDGRDWRGTIHSGGRVGFRGLGRSAWFRFGRLATLMIAVVFWLTASPVLGQPTLPADREVAPDVEVDQIDNAIRTQFAHLKELTEQKQFAEAFDLWSRLLETAPDRLVPARGEIASPDRFERYVPLREYCQMRMAEIGRDAPEVIQRYRRSMDGLLQKRFDEERTPRSEESLRRAVDRYFLGSRTGELLLEWGDLLLERGDFVGARRAWERASPHLRTTATRSDEERIPGGLPWWLVFRAADTDTRWERYTKVAQQLPARMTHLAVLDQPIDLAAIRARMVLASILEGATERAQVEMQLLQRCHPEAEGELAGKRGKWVDLVDETLRASTDWQVPKRSGDWTTFAQVASRNPQSIAIGTVSAKPAWTMDLPAISTQDASVGSGRPRPAEADGSWLSYHPVVAGERLFVAGPTGIIGVNLRSGMPLWDGRVGAIAGMVYPAEQVPDRSRAVRTVGVPRFTLHLNENQLWGKMYREIVAQDSADAISSRLGADQAYLVGLDLTAEGRLLRRWEPALAEFGPEWFLDGTPVVHGQRVFFSMRRQDAVRAQSHVVCIDADSGELLWRVFVASAESPRGRNRNNEFRHPMLTLQHGVLYFQSNLGAVAAIQADSGRINWLCRYPRSDYVVGDPDRADRFLYRDLTPCVLHAGSLIVAPSDSDRIFSLDAATGDLLWATDGERATDAVHLLGVADDTLIVSGDYLYWFDVYSGRCVAQYPTPAKDAPGFALPRPRGYGRGLLVNNEVWFPTHDKLLVFAQKPVARDPNATRLGTIVPELLRDLSLVERNATGGNLVAANGMLLIAGSQKLYAFPIAP